MSVPAPSLHKGSFTVVALAVLLIIGLVPRAGAQISPARFEQIRAETQLLLQAPPAVTDAERAVRLARIDALIAELQAAGPASTVPTPTIPSSAAPRLRSWTPDPEPAALTVNRVSPYSSLGARNRYTTRMYAEDGTYLGSVNANSDDYDYESVANPYGPYRSPYSAQSIQNPYSQYGSPYSPLSPTNPYTTTAPIVIYDPDQEP